jgi:hypothetical protein
MIEKEFISKINPAPTLLNITTVRRPRLAEARSAKHGASLGSGFFIFT